MKKYVITYDIGTTGIKTCLIEIEDSMKILASATAGYNLYVDDETVIRMVGKGLGISMMSEFMIRGNTDDVQCIPVTPECIRELGMGMKKEEEPSDSVKKLKECVLEYVGELKKRKKP